MHWQKSAGTCANTKPNKPSEGLDGFGQNPHIEVNNISYTPLDDDELVQMYKDPETTVRKMQKHFNVSSGTIYRHLKTKGIKSNRKTSIPWTNEETEQLIAARKFGLTGAELYEEIPTRKPAAIKSHVQRLRILKLVR